MTRQPWRRICRGTEWATLPGSREAPTTAIVRDSARILVGLLIQPTLSALHERELLDVGRLRRRHLARLAGLVGADAVPPGRLPYPLAHVALVLLGRVGAAAEQLPVPRHQVGPVLAQPAQVPLAGARPQVQRYRRRA